MHSIDLVDETFIAASPIGLAEAVADRRNWASWWPNRRLEVFMDRGVKGQRWAIAGDLIGSAEIWIEAYRDGAIVHYYLRADPASGAVEPRRADELRRREAVAWKRSVWMLKHTLEADRGVGTAAAAATTRNGLT